MNAAFISLALLLTWGAIGFGPLAVLAHQRPLMTRILLAPSLGLAFVTIPAFLISRQGYPVQSFAAWQLAISLFASGLATLAVYRRHSFLSCKDDLLTSGGLILLLLVGTALVGWPELVRGLNWLGYANDDMANYALSATRLMSHGYFEPPVVQAVLDGSDISQLFWYLTLESRPGGDLVLAVIASVLKTGVAPLFMPIMIALHGTLIAAVAGLAVSENPRRSVAITAIVIGAINPLIAFSTYSELLAQVGGLAQTAGLMGVLVHPWRGTAREMVSRAAAAGFLLFGLFIWYYEVLVLVLPAIGLYFFLHPREIFAAWKPLIVSVVAVISCIALLSGSYLPTALHTVQVEFQGGSIAYPSDVIVFPYFLIKQGLLSFWGLSPIVGEQSQSSWKLLLSIVLFGFATLVFVSALRHRRLSACIVAVLTAVALSLLWRQADFGVFKAVLYLQPFLAALLAIAIGPIFATGLERLSHVVRCLKCRDINSRPNLRKLAFSLAILAIAAASVFNELRTLSFYGRIASDQPGLVYFNQLLGASRLKLLSALSDLPRPASGGRYIIDSDNSILTKLFTLYNARIPVLMYSYNPFKMSQILDIFNKNFPNRAVESSASESIDIPFTWTTSRENDVLRLKPQSRGEPSPGDILVAAAADNSVLNRLQLGYPTSSPLQVRPIRDVTNHLAYLPTLEKARHYFDYDIPVDKFVEYRKNIALWPNEPDYFYKGRSFVAAGRYILLRVINPREKPRLLLDFTAGLQADGENRLPPVKIFAGSQSQIKAVGRGSARLYSQPIEPIRLGSAWVFGIDMGLEGRRFTEANGEFTLDTRRLTSYVRDISLISDDAYRNLKPPSSLRKFPDDLANKNLEYSGIYEDGWMAESAVIKLAGPIQPTRLVVSGTMPWDPKTSGVSQMIVRIDGVEKARVSLAQGQFFIPIHVERSYDPILVEIQTNGALPLGPVDRRPASVRLTAIGWDSVEQTYPSEYKPILDAGPNVDPVGIWSDGWSASHSELTLAGGVRGILTIRGTVPNLGGSLAGKLTVSANGTELGTADISPGEVTAHFPIPGSAGPRRIILDFSRSVDLQRPDTRRVGMLIQAVSVSSAQ